jgi:ABC-type nickel/cobalt efflux system permease component RcnA
LGQKLGHLRCDFRFEAKIGVTSGSARPADPAHPHDFRFRESNYELEEGRVRLSLMSVKDVTFQNKVQPDLKLQEAPLSELKPGDDAKLRTVAATFVVSKAPGVKQDAQGRRLEYEDGGLSIEDRSGSDRSSIVDPPSSKTDSTPLLSPSSPREASSLLELLLDPKRGIWVLLLLAGFFGAVHALAPGHGKTLVAAYLVGEHGTVWHALILGLVTTFTHTGAVLALAGILLMVNPERLPNLELFGGLLVAAMGLWLLLRRLAGQADHFHLGGHSHHHEHAHGHAHSDHYHDEQGHAHAIAPPTVGGWWGLIALGVSGGIVPCYDAIIMLIFAVSARRLWLALPLLLAFSAGLAGVLIIIGILVVQVKGFATTRWGVSRWFKSLPIVSAILVILLGVFLCYRSVHPSM